MTPDGPLDPARPLRTPAGWPAGCVRPRPRRLRWCCCTPTATPSTSARSATHSRDALPAVHVSLSHEVVGTFREYERAATTEIDAALSPLLAGYLRALVERAARGRAPRALDHAVQRRADRPRTPPRATRRGRSSRDPPAAPPGRPSWRAPPASRRRCASTWAEPHATSAWSMTERCRSRARARSPAGPWRCRCWRCTRSAPVAARSRGATPAGRCAWGPARQEPTPDQPATGAAGPNRRSPTPTCCSATSRPTLRWPAESSSTSMPPSARSESLAEELGLDLIACAEGIRQVAGAEMVRALRVVTVQRGVDPRGYALIAFGGRGPAARRADRRGARDRDDPLPARIGRAGGARAGRLAAAPGCSAKRALGRRGDHGRGDRRDRRRARRPGPPRARRAASRRSTRPTSSATAASRSSSRSPPAPRRRPQRAARPRSRPSTRSATATAIPSRRSSW